MQYNTMWKLYSALGRLVVSESEAVYGSHVMWYR